MTVLQALSATNKLALLAAVVAEKILHSQRVLQLVNSLRLAPQRAQTAWTTPATTDSTATTKVGKPMDSLHVRRRLALRSAVRQLIYQAAYAILADLPKNANCDNYGANTQPSLQPSWCLSNSCLATTLPNNFGTVYTCHCKLCCRVVIALNVCSHNCLGSITNGLCVTDSDCCSNICVNYACEACTTC